MPRPCRLALMLAAAVALSPWGSPGGSRGRGGRGGSGEGRGSWGGGGDGGLFTSGPLRVPTTRWEASSLCAGALHINNVTGENATGIVTVDIHGDPVVGGGG